MLFNSYLFIGFFACLLIVYYLIPNWRTRKLFLLVASYIFYSAWYPPYLLLLIACTLTTWLASEAIKESASITKNRFYLFIGIAVNLGILVYYKYAGFILENLAPIINVQDDSGWSTFFNVALPIGISFYTFQAMSYMVDSYRTPSAPRAGLMDYSLYVSFFPQLVAGPIVRTGEFLPQCVNPTKWEVQRVLDGCYIIVSGLFLKVIGADIFFAPITNRAFDTTIQLDFWSAWAGAFAFAGQIYMDFGGYSLCAIGAAYCLGFKLPVNFKSPYAAKGFSDFWRRWHISLSRWIRDYLYIPFGGNRVPVPRQFINLVIVMFIAGLWHGAAWTFVAWGVLHGLYLVAERLLKGFVKVKVPELLIVLITFIFTCLAWVLFRAHDFEHAYNFILAQVGLADSNFSLGTTDLLFAYSGIVALLLWQWFTRGHDGYFETVAKLSPKLKLLAFVGMLYMIIVSKSPGYAFLYFQF